MRAQSFSGGFVTAILGVALFVWGGCTLAQQSNNQAALARQSSIVFSGTVSRIGATSFADVPKSPQTLVVRVDSILKKPSAVSLRRGDDVTVEVKDPSAFQEGMHATFYTDGWIFGSGVAVKELGHEIGTAGSENTDASHVDEKPHGSMQDQISDQELRERLNSSDFVIIGRVTEVHPWKVPKSITYRITEHDPDWHEAVVQVQSVLKGGKVKGNKIVVRFAQRNDVAWVHSPKFEKNQQGIFCLNRDQLGGGQPNAYTCLGHGDSLPMSDEGRVRSILKSQ